MSPWIIGFFYYYKNGSKTDIFHEKTIFFKPYFLHTKHKHFLLNFTSIDREMFKLYEYNNLVILGQQYNDQNGRSLSTARSCPIEI